MSATVPALSPEPRRDRKPAPRFLSNGLPAEPCVCCCGTGNVESRRPPGPLYMNPPGDEPCPARCEDGLVPCHGLNAAVRLAETARDILKGEGRDPRWDALWYVEACIRQLEDVACERCAGDETVPEMGS